MNYYNDNDRFICTWLRELIKAGLIPDGEVDERDINEVQPDDLRGFAQHHFFTGIAGWNLALQVAGWPADEPIWTGSCPCQPFSAAGKRKGEEDPRHLWPAWFRLIRECRPTVIFGEQVAGADGRVWLAGVSADLASCDYRFGAADLPAASVGAPHIRQRLFWVADATGRLVQDSGRQAQGRDGLESRSEDGGMADAELRRSEERNEEHRAISEPHEDGEVGNSKRTGLEIGGRELQGTRLARPIETSPWFHAVWWPCRDEKNRRIPTQPAFFPVVDGIPGRVGLLRGAGNAIVPQVAAEFIKAFIETLS